MDGEYHGKPFFNGWFGGTPIFGNTQLVLISVAPALFGMIKVPKFAT